MWTNTGNVQNLIRKKNEKLVEKQSGSILAEKKVSEVHATQHSDRQKAQAGKLGSVSVGYSINNEHVFLATAQCFTSTHRVFPHREFRYLMGSRRANGPHAAIQSPDGVTLRACACLTQQCAGVSIGMVARRNYKIMSPMVFTAGRSSWSVQMQFKFSK